MVKDAIPWVSIPLIAGVLAVFFGLWWLAGGLFLLTAFMAYFFRDPRRVVPPDESLVLSPADGKVTRIEKIFPDQQHTSAVVVSIFLSPFDVHINRAPIAGEITNITYTKGRFLAATRDESSIVNEQNAVTIQGEHITIVCKQIAGVLARRIVCWKSQGDKLSPGERFGLIKFGSRTDLILPSNVKIMTSVGARVRGGITVIGKVKDDR